MYCPLLKREIDPVDCMEIEYRNNPPIFDKLGVTFSDDKINKICIPHRENNYKNPATE